MARARAQQTRERDARAVELRRRGLSYPQIAEQLGFSATSSAFDAVRRGIKDLWSEDNGEQTRIELDRLDDALRVLYRVMMSKHLAYSQGRVVVDLQGQPVQDDGPNVQAALGIVRLSESRRKLLGLDAPTRKVVEVITQDVVDAELAQLVQEVAANGGDVGAIIREVASGGAGHPGIA